MTLRYKLLLICIFSVAMGYLESTVVVYMREILYPQGFGFPLAPIPAKLAVTELIREAATIVMLACISFVAGRNITERFAYFLASFAIWDIFYYIFLKLLIGWPESLLTWDILFLIPVTWTGPVLSPVIVSLTMILLAWGILRYSSRNTEYYIPIKSLVMMAVGAFIIFVSFITDYSRYIFEHYSLKELWSLPSGKPLYDLSMQYIPSQFPWGIFAAGDLLLLAALFTLKAGLVITSHAGFDKPMT